jgi:excisionase family DNA binding protein
MGIIFDDLEDHEGYGARRRPDRTFTSTWTRETEALGAFVAACSCGWTGRHDHPPTEHGRTTADDEWELHYAQPLLAAAVQTRVRELADNLREEVAELADHRPPAPRAVAHRLARWSEHVLRLTESAEIRHRLACPTENDQCRDCRCSSTSMMEELNRNAQDDDRDRTAPSEKPSQRLTASVEEAAELLGISRGHGYTLVSRGEIPSLRLSRRVVFPLVALHCLLKKRIGDNPDSSHNRTEKAGAVPTAAIRLQRDALLAYGRWPEDDPNEHAVLTASRLLDDVAEHVRHTMWQAIRAAPGESPATSPSPSNDLVHAGEQLARWAARHDTERSARGIGL